MTESRLRTLKIKTGVVKRLTKDKVEYEKEAAEQRARIETLKRQGRDAYELRQEEEVLQECLMMIPDTQRRLLKAHDDLKSFICHSKELKDKPELSLATRALQEAQLQLPKPGEILHMC